MSSLSAFPYTVFPIVIVKVVGHNDVLPAILIAVWVPVFFPKGRPWTCYEEPGDGSIQAPHHQDWRNKPGRVEWLCRNKSRIVVAYFF